ncbi:CBS domain-containing protein [Streptomyces sp. NPDC053750]|uniref:CBS domain-containing protein n=1 Tax=Streptomyces sp. NPDC053750 TaxID=3365714 RepID=UPI0037CE5A0B
MARRGIKRLPVVDAKGVLQGIVSRGDLLRVFLRPDSTPRPRRPAPARHDRACDHTWQPASPPTLLTRRCNPTRTTTLFRHEAALVTEPA